MKPKHLGSALLIAMLIVACGPSAAATPAEPTPDIAAVRTSAASTVVSQFTLTAAAFTPTPAPPTNTPQPEATETPTQLVLAQVTTTPGTAVPLCDNMSFNVATVDANIPDGTIMSPGQDFIKTWRVRNNGSCPWGAGYALVYAGYAIRMNGQFIALTEVVQPGQEVEVSVQFKAPTQVGEYVSAWQMANPAGIPFPQAVYVKIIVQ